jgi:hypothetical protein
MRRKAGVRRHPENSRQPFERGRVGARRLSRMPSIWTAQTVEHRPRNFQPAIGPRSGQRTVENSAIRVSTVSWIATRFSKHAIRGKEAAGNPPVGVLEFCFAIASCRIQVWEFRRRGRYWPRQRRRPAMQRRSADGKKPLTLKMVRSTWAGQRSSTYTFWPWVILKSQSNRTF